MKARLRFPRGEVTIDVSQPVSLASPIDFSGREPRHFGAPSPHSQPYAAPGFSGVVATGASCNCSTITLTPHCNGTHTECVGHLTLEALDAHCIIPAGFLPAFVVSVTPEEAAGTGETARPSPRPGDRLITRKALERGWPTGAPFEPLALVIRTVGDVAGTPPYLSLECATLLVERGIEHVVTNLPSLDRSEDEGHLGAHRIFFGLPPGSRSLAQATRRQCTATELARVPVEVRDGCYLLELQAPALGGDAVPSRPLLYSLQP